jgi:hypothetical protein
MFWSIGIVLFGCGYRPLLTKPLTVEVLHVSQVVNQTSYRDISVPLTTLLRRDFARMGISSAAAGGGHWTLRVAVVDIGQKTTVIRREDARELPGEVTWHMQALFTLVSPDGQRPLDSIRIMETVSAPVSGQVTSELMLSQQARGSLMEAVSRRIAVMIFEF